MMTEHMNVNFIELIKEKKMSDLKETPAKKRSVKIENKEKKEKIYRFIRNTMLFLLGVIIIVLSVLFSYRAGQIDYANGKINYEKVKFQTEIWLPIKK